MGALARESTVTEAEWLAATDPGAMLAFAADRANDRKLRLFACACVRRFWGVLTDPRGRVAVEVAERFADGLAGRQELALAWHAVRRAREAVLDGSSMAQVLDAAERLTDDRSFSAPRDAVWTVLLSALQEEGLAASRAAFLKTLLKLSYRSLGPRLPWQPARGLASDIREAQRQAGDAYQSILATETCAQAALLRDIIGPAPFRTPVVGQSVLAWRDACVPKLAEAIYGALAWDRLPVLADALEEGGCTDADILSHCRQVGAHVRGCWVMDLIRERK
jgi:hypothetical protein